jgi:hypothetical protein
MPLRWVAVIALAGMLALASALNMGCTSCGGYANFVIKLRPIEQLGYKVRLQLAGRTFAFDCPGETHFADNVFAHCSSPGIVIGGPDLDIDTNNAILTVERADQSSLVQDAAIEFGSVQEENPDGCPAKGGCCSRSTTVP